MITIAELRSFHNIDRQAYARFVFQLGLDSDTSKKIIAFWNWLETEGYKNFTHNSLELPPTMLRQLAVESTLCLNSLEDLIFLHAGPGDYLPVMSIVGHKALSLEFVYTKKEIVKKEVTWFISRVCQQAFSDIVPPIPNNHPQILEPVLAEVQEDNENHPQIMENQQVNDDDDVGSRTDRTLFATFSRGHPITREQLEAYFEGKFGQDCVDDIIMNDPNGGETLYALLIVSSLSYVDRILGKSRLVQFNIHGKDVRLRKFIPKDAA